MRSHEPDALNGVSLVHVGKCEHFLLMSNTSKQLSRHLDFEQPALVAVGEALIIKTWIAWRGLETQAAR